MTNYREVFNTNYSIVGLIIITLVIGLIILTNQNIKSSFKVIGKTIFISGIITIIVSFLIKIVSSIVIPNKYQIITNVIIKNIEKNLIIYSLISILIGMILIMITSLIPKKKL